MAAAAATAASYSSSAASAASEAAASEAAASEAAARGSSSSAASAAAEVDIRDSICPGDLVVNSDRALSRPLQLQELWRLGYKPQRGLWYSVGPAWLDWVRDVLPEREKR